MLTISYFNFYLNLRFSGFNDEWQNSIGKKTFELLGGGSFKSKDSVNEGVLWLKIANVGINQIKNNDLSYLPIDFLNTFKKYLLKKGDVILALTRPILDHKLKIAIINEKFNNSLLNQRVGKITSLNEVDIKFIYYYLQLPYSIYYLESKISGSDPPNLSNNDLLNMPINMPSSKEQHKISQFLTLIDKKIELLEQKYQKYQDFKMYFMQQIFTQKLRFNFKDKWKQFKLKNLLTVKSSNISINQLEDNTGEYPLYGASGFLKNIDFCEMETDYISIVKDGSGVGNLSYHEKNSSIVNTSQYLLPKKDFDIHFLYYQLQTLNLLKYVNGSSIPHIYFKDYCIEKVSVPSLPEQQQIGKLFVDTDKTLENIDNCIRITQEFKKGLLQQMFI